MAQAPPLTCEPLRPLRAALRAGQRPALHNARHHQRPARDPVTSKDEGHPGSPRGHGINGDGISIMNDYPRIGSESPKNSALNGITARGTNAASSFGTCATFREQDTASLPTPDRTALAAARPDRRHRRRHARRRRRPVHVHNHRCDRRHVPRTRHRLIPGVSIRQYPTGPPAGAVKLFGVERDEGVAVRSRHRSSPPRGRSAPGRPTRAGRRGPG